MLVHLAFPFVPSSFSDFAIGVNTTEDKKWDLLDFFDYGPTEEFSPHGLDAHEDLTWLPSHPEESNFYGEESIQRVQETTTESIKVEKEQQPCEEPIATRKRKRNATDCRVEWRASISSAKAAILENVKKITNDEMLLREKYGELKGVARVREMSKDYKDKDTLKDIFKKEKEGLTNAKRELTRKLYKGEDNTSLPILPVYQLKHPMSAALKIVHYSITLHYLSITQPFL